MHFSKKKSGRLSSTRPEILAFSSHHSADFQLILDSFIPNFRLKHEDSQNMKTYHDIRYSRFRLTLNQREELFGTPGSVR